MTSLNAAALDADDPLAEFRQDFVLNEGEIYLDGNSLGLPTHQVLKTLSEAALHEWGRDQIRSWNTAGWFEMPLRLGDQIGRLIGAAAGQVVVADTTSANIYKLLHAALGLQTGRHVILAEGGSFPTDLYVAEGVAQTLPHVEIRLETEGGPRLEDMLSPEVAVVLVNQVNYKTGALRDMAALTAKAHAVGALVIWDLCHSAGALPVELDACKVDFAVGCSYKYLNGGPGAPAFLYVAARHLGHARQPLSGWWGHAAPFAFDKSYTPAPDIRAFQCGTQPILSLRALGAALELWERVDMAALRRKSLALTDLFIAEVEARCEGLGLTLDTPREGALRGSQVAFRHPEAYAVMQALIAAGVIGDFRAPDTLRFGFTPLYLRHADVVEAARRLEAILRSESYRDPRFATRAAVT